MCQYRTSRTIDSVYTQVAHTFFNDEYVTCVGVCAFWDGERGGWGVRSPPAEKKLYVF